jgi:hypothetical protein
MCFNFQNMAVLYDINAEQSKFRFSRSPCGDGRYLVIPCRHRGPSEAGRSNSIAVVLWFCHRSKSMV